MNFKKLNKFLPIIALLGIFIFSYYIRSMNILIDRILSFDPVFQYRFTKYVVDFGHVPLWDELTYYVGKLVYNTTPLMWYATAFMYKFLNTAGLSLKTVASYASAIYGALLVIPAYLLGKELSNKYGGLLAGILVGTAPQIMIRTFGSSFDTDQIAIFFILATLWLGIYALKNRNIFSYSMLIIGFLGFTMAWNQYWYTFFFIIAALGIYTLLEHLKKSEHSLFSAKRIIESLTKVKSLILGVIGSFIGIVAGGYILGFQPIKALFDLIGFASAPEEKIVNISIAELQIINLTSISTWITSLGRFMIGDYFLDRLIFMVMIAFLAAGIYISYKKDKMIFSYIITMVLLGFFTVIRGIRFTEFSSAILLCLVGAGFGLSYSYFKEKDRFLKMFSIGLALMLAFVGVGLGFQYGMGLGPDVNQNWQDAWDFLRDETPEMSLVGTWWDPGHMITGLAERRVIADGAHCGFDCMYTINDRITDLGKIFATTDENVSATLLRKYQGTSPEVYWIASDDLIGKFRWLQYFGMGCDGVSEARCPLYYQINRQNVYYINEGQTPVLDYGEIKIVSGSVPVPIFVQNNRGALFDEYIFYLTADTPQVVKVDEQLKEDLISTIEPFEDELGFRFTNQTISTTLWVPSHYSNVVIIPPHLRESVFTKMFMLEGQGLENFEQVFRNDQVKIYKLIQ